MKKKYIFLYLILLGSVLSTPLITSCESMLEEKPFDFISPDDVEDSDNGADMWVVGVYNTLHESMFRYGSFPRPLDYDCDYISGAVLANLVVVISREEMGRLMLYGMGCMH